MNKFYEQYKDLFPLPDKKSLSNPYMKMNYHQPSIQDFVNQKAYRKKNNIINPKQNQFKNIFKRYAKNQFNSYTKPQQLSPAAKQFSNIILPRLQMYDEQIQRKLKRYHTQNEQLQKNNSMFEYNITPEIYNNKFSKLQARLRDKKFDYSTEMNPQSEKYERKREYKFPSQKQSRNDNIFLRNSQQKFQDDQKIRNRISYKNKKSFVFEQNPQQNPEQNEQILGLDSRIHKQDNQQGENLQTEYQRSYSNKKLNLKQDQLIWDKNQIQLNIQRRIKKEQNKKQRKHFHDQLKTNEKILQNHSWPIVHQSNINDQSRISRQSPTKKKVRNFPQSYEQQAVNQPIQLTFKGRQIQRITQSRFRIKTQPPRKQPSKKQQGLNFSQYQNQYAFISKRLQDIQHFNNYYHHTVINAYKQAILRRIQAKRNVQKRKQKLKYLIAAQYVSLS